MPPTIELGSQLNFCTRAFTVGRGRVFRTSASLQPPCEQPRSRSPLTSRSMESPPCLSGASGAGGVSTGRAATQYVSLEEPSATTEARSD
eukprot:scaffold88212_cov57-Phaeocystis_antarctica.AAC.1